MIMKNRITAPKPQLMQSRNDMLKTSVDLRLRAILLLHEDHAHFHARGTNPKDIADLQDGGTVDAMAIKKRSVTTLIRNHALAICRHDFTMSAGVQA
jgi:hypothetical protein